MEIKSAIRLINDLGYKPGWTIEAESYEQRFEGTVMVKFTFPAYESERHFADATDGAYNPEPIESYAKFPIMVGDITDQTELYGRVLDAIRRLEMHEAREFLRVRPTWWAPFHPHRVDGMKRWAERTGEPLGEDFRYGLA